MWILSKLKHYNFPTISIGRTASSTGTEAAQISEQLKRYASDSVSGQPIVSEISHSSYLDHFNCNNQQTRRSKLQKCMKTPPFP
jgi:hypothetical protein